MAAETVLIVDHDADTREILVLALERAGFRTFAHEDGAAALALLDAVDCVITDLYVPAGDERCLVRAIKRHPLHHDLPVIAYTTRLAPNDREWAQRQGCDLMLGKPTSIAIIVDHVRALVGRRVAPGKTG